MKMFIGVTDLKWFNFLREQRPDEVNFWKPGGSARFRALEPGAPFLFKLHKPFHSIVGGGFYTGFARMTVSQAWDAFGEKNGSADYTKFLRSIRAYRRRDDATFVADPEIGCVVLTSPFFLDQRDWIPAPDDWANSIVQGKGYETTVEPGATIWARLAPLLAAHRLSEGSAALARENVAQYDAPILGSKYLRTARLGQGAFRALTLENYGRRCCITGETTLPVLQAAHIKPVSEKGTHSPINGLLMRADLHILYDRGLIGITPDYRVRVSRQIRHQFLNGKVYYAHDDTSLRSLPTDPELQPDPDLLSWHLGSVFVP